MNPFETRPADWLSVEQALSRIMEKAKPVGSEEVALAAAQDRTLAADVYAGATLPPWDNSAMDGYALKGADVSQASADSPVGLRIVGESRAGLPYEGPELSPGTTVRIMTGAPIPEGVDVVVRVEDTNTGSSADTVLISTPVPIGQNIREGGEDWAAGDRVLSSGTTIGPGQIGVLSAAGHGTALVSRRPRVGILPSGDELVGVDRYHEVVAGRAIPDSNGPALAAAVRMVGGDPVLLPAVSDDREEIRSALSQLRDQTDLIVTIGGASMGAHDLFKSVLEGLDFTLHFWRVRMRPGSPSSFGEIPVAGRSPLPVFGLPGNPASAFVTFEVLVRPFLLALSGRARTQPPHIEALAGERMPSRSGLTFFSRVTLEPCPGEPPRAFLAGPQGSGLVGGLGIADGLGIIPEDVAELAEGETLTVLLLDPNALGGAPYR